MKLSKKIISGLLAFTLAFGAVTVIPEQTGGNVNTAVVASAAEYYKTVNGFVLSKDDDGDIYVSDYTGKGGNITIPSEATYIGQKAFADNTSITAVTFPKGTTKYGIGDNAFDGCTFLSSVTIKGDVGSGDINGIGSAAFIRCHSLKKVTFTDPNAHVSFIGDSAFRSCYALSSINIPTGTVKIYDNAFTNCLKLSSVTIPENTELDGNYTFGYMFGSENSNNFYSYVESDYSLSKYVFSVKADGKKTVYWEICAADESEAKKLCRNTVSASTKYTFSIREVGDDVWEPIPYTFCCPIKQCAITLNVTEGSAAEKWAKSRGIKYKSTESAASAAQLDAPENLEAITSSKSVTLVWDDVKGASAYRVYKYNPKTNKYEKCKDVASYKCKVTGLSPKTKYKFKVVALKKKGNTYKEGEYATISVTTKK